MAMGILDGGLRFADAADSAERCRVGLSQDLVDGLEVGLASGEPGVPRGHVP